MKTSLAIKFTVSLALVICLSSCKKMLEEYNPSGLTAQAVYTTPEGYETLVNAAYSYNRHWYGKEDGMGLSEFGTDLWYLGEQGFSATSGVAYDNQPLVTYKNLTSVNQNVTRLWRRLYGAVNLCNTGIKIAKTGGLGDDGGNFKPDPKRVAELKFLRAWYYWHIVETWGAGSHFTTEPTTVAITTANNTSVATIYAQIITDLNEAIIDLPGKGAESNWGRVNVMAAKAFLARVYLTRGWINNDPADFALAKSNADAVIGGGYSLQPKYEDLWIMDAAHQKNNEVIWSQTYSIDPNNRDTYDPLLYPDGYGIDILSASNNPTNSRGADGLHALFIPLYDKPHDSTYDTASTAVPKAQLTVLQRDVRNGWPFDRVRPTKYLMDVFDETIDSRYTGSFQIVWKLNKTGLSRLAGRIPYVDTAILVTKNAPASKKYYTMDVYKSYDPTTHKILKSTVQNGQMFPTLKKFMDSTRFSPGVLPGNASNAESGSAYGAKDVFVIRLAEMYMIAAEAEWKMNGATAIAVGYINVLRTRAALPGKTAAMTSTTQADLGANGINYILDERAREFAGENTRWFDLKRTGQLTFTRLDAYNPDISSNFTSNYLVRPIPQQQIDAVTNKSEFKQNPGY